MVNHIDMLGNKINVNDIVVAYGTITGGYSSFTKHSIVFGKVIKLTPKMVTIKCIKVSGKEKDQIRVRSPQVAIIDKRTLPSLMKKKLEET